MEIYMFQPDICGEDLILEVLLKKIFLYYSKGNQFLFPSLFLCNI